MNYFETIDEKLLEYYKLLSPRSLPKFLNEYIYTPTMQRQKYIGVHCGRNYSKSFSSDIFYSSLDHSIGVALIVWYFTEDKKETLAALFHDIATPVFKHSIDFLNGDYMTQESTENLTEKFIRDSKELSALLYRDSIKIEEVSNYHMYPIADNDAPRLSADRLEYSLSNSMIYKVCDFEKVKRLYNDVYISYNEDGDEELAFKCKKWAIYFVKVTSQLSVYYRDDITRFSMQFLADIVKKLNDDGVISIEDLYTKKEEDIIKIIEESKYGKYFDKWKNAKKVNVSKEEPKNVYYVHHGAKIRYIDPLVKQGLESERISKVNKPTKRVIQRNLDYDMDNYVYLNFKM